MIEEEQCKKDDFEVKNMKTPECDDDERARENACAT